MSDRRQSTGAAARRERLLTGPIVPTLLSLAAPMVLVLTMQATINLVETHFIGRLGVEPLAGAALVFPVIVLMQMVSSGGLGGGIASTVARAIGAGDPDRAAGLIGRGLLLAVICGLACTVLGLAVGPAVYRDLGGSPEMIGAARAYSNTIFAGAVLIWGSNALASSLRGAGEMMATAAIILIAAAAAVALSPCLILGLGPFPRLGVVGAGLAILAYYGIGAVGFLGYLINRHGWRRLVGLGAGARVTDILALGGLSSLMALLSSLAVVIVTGLADHYGSLVLAGYGIGSRLDALLVPPIFGLGAATVTMVGMNVGAGETGRAERVAWLGALVAALALEAIGLAATAFPRVWLDLFSDDPAVLKAGARYLHAVAPFYGCLGIGTILHFASIGAGRSRGPLFGMTLRALIAAGGGALVVAVFGGTPRELFAMVAYGLVGFALVNATFILCGSLQRARPMPQLGSSPAAKNPPSTTKVWPVT